MTTPALDDVMTAVRALLLSLGGSDAQVVQGLQNRVPLPKPRTAVMTPLYGVRLATNWTDNDPLTDERSLTQPTRLDVQVDFYGIGAADWAISFSTLWRDGWAVDMLAPASAAPLFVDDIRQMPLVSGEEQYLERWTCTAASQYNPVTTVPQQFADAAAVGVISVDEAYPP